MRCTKLVPIILVALNGTLFAAEQAEETAVSVPSASNAMLCDRPPSTSKERPVENNDVTIAGVVVDSKGSPVPNAVVNVGPNPPAKADSKGRFSLQLDREDARYMLIGKSVDGSLFGRRSLSGDYENQTLTLKPIPEQSVAGVIKDRSGALVENVEVQFGSKSMITGKDGKFLLRAGVAPSQEVRWIRAAAIDGTSGVNHLVCGDRNNQIITLRQYCTCSLKLSDESGRPVSGFEFWVRDGDTGVSHPYSSNIEGNCTLKRLQEGTAYTVVWGGGAKRDGFVRGGERKFVAKPDAVIELTTKNYQPPKGTIGVKKESRLGIVSGFCLDAKENLVVCDRSVSYLKVISQDDDLLATWELGFRPQVIERCDDGFAVAGSGDIAVLDSTGGIIARGSLPLKSASATGIGMSRDFVFVSVSQRSSYAICRMPRDLKSSQTIIKGLRGCCGQMDFTVRGHVVYVAENSRARVGKYDFNGNRIGQFGKRSGKFGFKGCCEPKNVSFDAKGYIYTAESEKCCVKKFTVEGQCLGRVGRVEDISGCVRVTIAITSDHKLYMIDQEYNLIRLVPWVETQEASIKAALDRG